jgi:YfiH family protein
MKELWRGGTIRVMLCEAFLNGLPWDARKDDDVETARLRLRWPKPLRATVQVHGTRILGPEEQGEADGFLLGAGEAALIRHADCFPVAVLDPRRGAAALLHCGWRGAAGHLAAKGVERLVAAGSRREDLEAVIGPGIGPRDFEVGPEVLERFPESVHSLTSRGTSSVDLIAFLRQELSESGLSPEKISCDSRSTLGDLQLHSYRRAGARAGRMATLCLIAPTGGT